MNKYRNKRVAGFDSSKEAKRFGELEIQEAIVKKIKPLSVNDCWQGKRFKTSKYKSYEQELLLTLPKINLPKPPFEIYFEFGFSNVMSDWDNPVKPLQDILQKKYGFNDKDIYRAVVNKVMVKKGEEYFKVKIMTL
jgi:hypothetical protein